MDSSSLPPPQRRPVPAERLTWLRGELDVWQRDGLLDPAASTAILDRYVPVSGRRLSLGRLMLGLGGVFVGVGLIWLVAANLDQLPPLLRFGVVACCWLGFLIGGEVAAARGVSAPVVGALRLLAALTFGATIFQAAQSLQVPAYAPSLLGLWSAGVLVHAYAVRAWPPLVVAVPVGVGWWLWQALETGPTPLGGVLAGGTLCVAAVSAAVLHDRRLTRFAQTWRVVGVTAGLAALFVAALPGIGIDGPEWSVAVIAQVVVALVLAALAVVWAPGRLRLEPLGAIVVVASAVGLLAWEAGDSVTDLGVQDWAHALVSVALYVVVAVGVAALGVMRDNPVLTFLATAALVLFTTVQSFAVFAQIIQGAWLFVVLGVIFLGTGLVFDRARRGLAAQLDDVPTAGAGR